MAKKKRDGVPAYNRGPHDPMQDQTPTGRKRAMGAKKGGKSASGPDRAQCTAHKRNGDRCNNPPVRGSTVCRMHGGAAPQVKAKANQRLIEMVLPAMRELRRIIDSKTASDADKLKAVSMVLQRTGFNERHQIDIGLREPTPFDHLTQTGFVVIQRGVENVIDGDDTPALPPGEGGVEDEALRDLLDQRERTRAREASTRLDQRGHDVVPGAVVSPEEANLFGFERSREQKYRDSRPSELDPEGTRPEGDPWADYERRVREGLE